MKNNMLPKIFCFVVLMLLFAPSALAFTKSTQHQMPYLVEGFTSFRYEEIDERIPNARIYIKNTRTGYVTYMLSNNNGYFVHDLRSLQVKYPYDRAYDTGDVIQVYMTNDKIYEFQIGGKELCKYHGGEDCDKLANSQGGHHIDFNLAADDLFVYDVPDKEPVTISAEEWYEKYKAEFAIAIGVMAILAAAGYVVYQRDKTKYKWLPGMIGILNWRLKNWIKAYNDPKNYTDEDVEKLKKTFYKHANTITRKYIKQIESGEIEPGV